MIIIIHHIVQIKAYINKDKVTYNNNDAQFETQYTNLFRSVLKIK